MSEDYVVAAARCRVESVVRLAQDLVRLPSRGGLDSYEPVLDCAESWLAERAVPYRRLYDSDEGSVGLLVEVAGGRPGSQWALDACLDTAAYGDEDAWTFAPTAGDVVDGWLRGRGAADSKLAAATFLHLAEDLHRDAARLTGGVSVLLDVDEHTGAFGGARAYLADADTQRPAGVMIGYPGYDEVVVGGRGLWRATVTVHAPAGHSGSSRHVTGAISRAARLVTLLDQAELPAADGRFPLPAKVTVTAISGGSGFSVTPDRVDLNVDVRLTSAFDGDAAAALVHEAARRVDAEMPGPVPTEVAEVACWPPFRLAPTEEPAAALLRAAGRLGVEVATKTAGPSNIGNLLASHGVPATAGFGVPYEGLHGIDERARLAELPLVYATYHRALLDLLKADASARPEVSVLD
ncbi:peptidase dimerization protein [Streptomyces sp. CB02959]|uniref:M20 family metallopeptidase n=1 Tax=Streptomyces sp. CB02959 TaxID=2020330 RepID=UPI000C27BE90|nr:M20/M25/M40 family metallo-hydrolase [Streptomyces sp. CB02959]PJN32197.1 peptidase dimerization protein [Streptomyces sp. CB02959]